MRVGDGADRAVACTICSSLSVGDSQDPPPRKPPDHPEPGRSIGPKQGEVGGGSEYKTLAMETPITLCGMLYGILCGYSHIPIYSQYTRWLHNLTTLGKTLAKKQLMNLHSDPLTPFIRDTRSVSIC